MAFCRPHDGGCWYCSTDNPPLVFCCEFDTYIHVACIKRRIEFVEAHGLYDPELEFIREEFGM